MLVDMKDMSGKILWTKGYEAGEERERNRISVMAQARICFDFNAGSCKHSACYALQDLITFLEQK